MARQSRRRAGTLLLLLAPFAQRAYGQQNCYYGAGESFRAPSNVVPCLNEGTSSCCYLGDTCLSGNACFNYATGDLYQIGCTDQNYEDASCPYKCGFDVYKSPWTALEYCNDLEGVEDTWVCHSPESCGCEWTPSDSLLKLQMRSCKAMGSMARVALYAPSTLAPYVSLPSTFGGATTYYSAFTSDGVLTWGTEAVIGYTPDSIGPFTTYATPAPQKVIQLEPDAEPSPSTLDPAYTLGNSPTQVLVSTYSSAAASSTKPVTATQRITKTQIITKTDSAGNEVTSSQTLAPGGLTGAAAGVSSASATNSDLPKETGSGSGGLSTGAKAGIGAGIGVAALAAIGLGIFFLLRRRKRKARESTQSRPDSLPSYHSDYKHNPKYESVPTMQQYPGGVVEAPPDAFYDRDYRSNSPGLYEASNPSRHGTKRAADGLGLSGTLSGPSELDGGYRGPEMESPPGTWMTTPDNSPPMGSQEQARSPLGGSQSRRL